MVLASSSQSVSEGAAIAFNVLALTALLILAVSPLALYDVSFQLSFVAVASILFMVPVFSLYLPDEKKIRESRYPRLVRTAIAVGLFPCGPP